MGPGWNRLAPRQRAATEWRSREPTPSRRFHKISAVGQVGGDGKTYRKQAGMWPKASFGGMYDTRNDPWSWSFLESSGWPHLPRPRFLDAMPEWTGGLKPPVRSEEHTSELQSQSKLVSR